MVGLGHFAKKKKRFKYHPLKLTCMFAPWTLICVWEDNLSDFLFWGVSGCPFFQVLTSWLFPFQGPRVVPHSNTSQPWQRRRYSRIAPKPPFPRFKKKGLAMWGVGRGPFQPIPSTMIPSSWMYGIYLPNMNWLILMVFDVGGKYILYVDSIGYITPHVTFY